ncbi:PleD family two-component system response regulator [Candidatus Omnitrophota bacterium]
MSKGRVLAVDDEPEFAKMVSYRLKSAGYSVDIAFNGKQCIEQAKVSLPDIIVLDIKMPELDGIATAFKLKASPATSKIPIIMCTGIEDDDAQVLTRNLNVVDYFKKSSDMKELVTKVDGALNK